MQLCTYCGAVLPANARFCGNCGHVSQKVRAVNAQSPGAWVAVPDATAPTPQGAPMASEQPPADTLRQEQGAPANMGDVPTRRYSHGPAWSPPQQQPPPHGQQVPPWQVNAFALGPQPFSPDAAAGTPRRRVLGMPLGVFITVLVCLLVLDAAGAVLVYVISHHAAGPGPEVTSSHASSPGGGNAIAMPGGTSTNLALSGAVTGQLEVIEYSSCGPTNNGTQYGLNMQGKLGGNQYALLITISAFKGPGSYAKDKILGSLTRQPGSITTHWVNAGSQTASAVVNPGNASGTLRVDMAGTMNTLHIAGSWQCP
jgi:zinc-ribbon domain